MAPLSFCKWEICVARSSGERQSLRVAMSFIELAGNLFGLVSAHSHDWQCDWNSSAAC
jgi:hypothetical protein